MKLLRTLKNRRWLMALAACTMSLLGATAHARVVGITGPNFNLEAKADMISAADGASIYNWGYSVGGSTMQYPGPTLIVDQGQTVTVTLTNHLPTRTSIVFPGQGPITVSGGAAPSGTQLTGEAAAGGGSITYSFVASQPGTYSYHSGTQMDVQVEMGLIGALIVRPSINPTGQAYEHAGTAFTPQREYLVLASEIDPVRHQSVSDQVTNLPANPPTAWRVDTSQWGPYAPRYWFLNGRTSPDTLASAGAPALPNQPYNALVQMVPGDTVLLRLINMGRDLHPFHHHGNHTWTIARDGRMLSSGPGKGPDLAQSDFTVRMVPGQTVDSLYRWTGAGLGWDIYADTCNAALAVSATNCRSGKYNAAGVQTAAPFAGVVPTQVPGDFYKPLPTRLPAELELSYGEMFSGSPYLGGSAGRPVGAGQANTTGGYFHMMHSHNEREITNNGIFPGGMMTMVLIQPPGTLITD